MEHPSQISPPPLHHAVLRTAWRLVLIAAFVWAALRGYDWLMGHIDQLETAARERMLTLLAIAAIMTYAVLIAIPFVPAIEIGVALMVMEGALIAPYVWFATVMGLTIGYLIGAKLSLNWLHNIFRDLHMMRACALLYRIKTEPRAARLAELESRLPKWFAPFATKYRYISIALLLNLPGNFAIGGGGGIVMFAGISRLFTTPRMILTIALATAPVPFVVFGFGTAILT